MSLNSNALCLLATLKEHLDIQPSDTSLDSKLNRLINVASQFIENYCGRVLVEATYEEYHDGRAGNRLLLKQWPIVGGPADSGTKPEVIVDANGVFAASDAVDVASYWVANDIELVRQGLWPKGYRNIKVSYTAGLGKVNTTAATNTLPSDLEQACLDYAEWLHTMNTDRRIGRNTKTKGDESVAFISDIPPHVAMILEKYVRHEFPSDAPVGVRNG
jgi:hypothetical protein